jgi:nonsense-mediated mRNA decay protein 3
MVRDRVAAMRKSSRGAFISKIERVKGGLDFYFSTAKAAGAVAREIQDTRCAEYKESSSLWGRRDGEEVYRMTYLVRMPGFARGDVVEFEGRDYFVSRMSRNAVQGIDLVTGEERLLKIKSVDSCVLAAGKSKILKAVVLVDKEREVQVLDPEGMSPLDIVKPRGFVRNGEQIRLVKTRLGAYVLSDSW